MSKPIKLITNTERRLREITEILPGLRPTHDRYCQTCKQYLRVGHPSCGEDHEIRELNPREQEAATVYEMDRYL